MQQTGVEEEKQEVPRFNLMASLAIMAILFLFGSSFTFGLLGGNRERVHTVPNSPSPQNNPQPESMPQPVADIVPVPVSVKETKLEPFYNIILSTMRRHSLAIIISAVVLVVLTSVAIGLSVHFENERIAKELELARQLELERQQQELEAIQNLQPESRTTYWSLFKKFASRLYLASFLMTIGVLIYSHKTGTYFFFPTKPLHRFATYILLFASLHSAIFLIILLLQGLVELIKSFFTAISGSGSLGRIVGMILIFVVHVVLMISSIAFLPMAGLLCLIGVKDEMKLIYKDIWWDLWGHNLHLFYA